MNIALPFSRTWSSATRQRRPCAAPCSAISPRSSWLVVCLPKHSIPHLVFHRSSAEALGGSTTALVFLRTRCVAWRNVEQMLHPDHSLSLGLLLSRHATHGNCFSFHARVEFLACLAQEYLRGTVSKIHGRLSAGLVAWIELRPDRCYQGKLWVTFERWSSATSQLNCASFLSRPATPQHTQSQVLWMRSIWASKLPLSVPSCMTLSYYMPNIIIYNIYPPLIWRTFCLTIYSTGNKISAHYYNLGSLNLSLSILTTYRIFLKHSCFCFDHFNFGNYYLFSI